MDAQPLGRWIALDTVVPDPADPQALNRYSYVLGNPLKYTDPSGHTQCATLAPYGPLVFGCQVVEQVMLHGPEIVQLIQQLTISVPVLPAAADPANNPITAIQSLGGNTAGPGGLDPNNWGPSRFTFKSNSLLRSHFEKHVLGKPEEAWEDVLGVSRSELEAARSDPGQLTQLQDAYVQVGQQTSRVSNLIGTQAKGQQVFVDTGNRVTAILQGDRFLSLYRITTWKEFAESMRAAGLQLAPGVNLDALKAAMGF